MSFLHAVQFERSVGSDISLDSLCCKVLAVVGSMVAEEKLCTSAFFHDDEYTTVYHQVYSRAQNVYHLHRFVYYYILLHIHQQSVLCQHCVESGDAVLVGLCQTGVVFGNKLRVLLGIVGKRRHYDAFRKIVLGLQCLAELVVYYEVERGTEIRNVATERLVWINWHFDTVDVQSVVWFEELVDSCIFISLNLSRRETQALEIGKGCVTHCVQCVGAVYADLFACVTIKVDVLLFAVHYYSSPISALIQSYPLCSISLASSGPAVFTMRPL